MKWVQKAAESGDTKFQYMLGLFYEDGIGAQKNIAEAIRWFKKAAEQGLEEAKEKLDVLGVDY